MRYLTLHPPTLAENLIVAPPLVVNFVCVCFCSPPKKRGSNNFLKKKIKELVLTQGLSLSHFLSPSPLSGHEALTPHCVVVMLLLLSLFGYHGAGRCPGQSRGFAFVEFNVIQEATRWMETNQVTPLHRHTYTCIHAFSGTYGLVPGQM